MQIERLRLRGFRCYEDAEATFSPGLTAVVGANGAGKTSLLEAVHFALAGYSPRTAAETRCIRDGAGFFRIEAAATSGGREHVTTVALAAGEPRRVTLDGKPVRSLTDLARMFDCLVFLPERLAVVQRAPAVRRAYLDRAAVRADPGHARETAAYGRALAQRNAALRRVRAGVGPAASLDAWDERLAIHGAAVIAGRRRLCEQLADPFAEVLQALGGRAGATLRYAPRVGADDLARALADRRGRDVERAATGTGPHLDDVALDEGGRELRAFGSQGEQRTAVLALLLAEARLVAARLGEPPVLLLDDVFSELDAARRRRLIAVVREIGQAIVTTTERAHLPAPPDAVATIEAGAITLSA
jgi:DNA replication and repair protein RecF